MGMTHFRLKAVTPEGKDVQTEFKAKSRSAAKKLVDDLARKRALRIHAVEKKQVYLYKVRKKDGSALLTGEQEAYNKAELERALVRLGYKVIRIQRKLFEFKGGVSTKEVVTFIRLSADLLRQNLPYDEILGLLVEDTQNQRMKKVIREIQKDLKDGKEGAEVYGKHEKVFGKFATYMMSVASTSGNMALVFENTAKFIERESDFKKNLRKSLLMPAVMVIAVVATVLFYVAYIFPAQAEMFLEYNIQLPPMTAQTLAMSYWLQANWIVLTLCFVIPLGGALAYIQTTQGRLLFDKYIIKTPVIGDILHKTSIEIFSRVFYTLYSGSGQNVDVIRIASEACRNSYMEHQIKEYTIKQMLKEGKGLVEGFVASGIFPKTAISRFKMGAESGSLRENARQLAEYYEVQTTYKMDAAIEMISLGVNLLVIIALIAITIVSSEAALIRPEAGGY